MRTNYHVMTRRSYEADAKRIEPANDLIDLFPYNRESWRADSSKAKRRQRRYKKHLTNYLIKMDYPDNQ